SPSDYMSSWTGTRPPCAGAGSLVFAAEQIAALLVVVVHGSDGNVAFAQMVRSLRIDGELLHALSGDHHLLADAVHRIAPRDADGARQGHGQDDRLLTHDRSPRGDFAPVRAGSKL